MSVKCKECGDWHREGAYNERPCSACYKRLCEKMLGMAWQAAHMAVQYDYPRFDWSPGDDFADLARELNESVHEMVELHGYP